MEHNAKKYAIFKDKSLISPLPRATEYFRDKFFVGAARRYGHLPFVAFEIEELETFFKQYKVSFRKILKQLKISIDVFFGGLPPTINKTHISVKAASFVMIRATDLDLPPEAIDALGKTSLFSLEMEYFMTTAFLEGKKEKGFEELSKEITGFGYLFDKYRIDPDGVMAFAEAAVSKEFAEFFLECALFVSRQANNKHYSAFINGRIPPSE